MLRAGNGAAGAPGTRALQPRHARGGLGTAGSQARPPSSRMFHVKHLFWSSIWRIVSGGVGLLDGAPSRRSRRPRRSRSGSAASGSPMCGKIRLLAIGPPVSPQAGNSDLGLRRPRSRRRRPATAKRGGGLPKVGFFRTLGRRERDGQAFPGDAPTGNGGVERDLAHNPLTGLPAPIPRGFHPDGALSRLRGRGGATRGKATWGNARNREGKGPDPQQVGENCAWEARPAGPRRRAFAGPTAGLCPNLT